MFTLNLLEILKPFSVFRIFPSAAGSVETKKSNPRPSRHGAILKRLLCQTNLFLGFGFVADFFLTDCTIVNHHFTPPFGRLCLELLPRIMAKQIQDSRQFFYHSSYHG